ncbi:MAG: hypothetical protein VKN60_07625 [Cyanobacteriota bacterium]|nr:hypothetical protein [Cyanobacteriota bacterium]
MRNLSRVAISLLCSGICVVLGAPLGAQVAPGDRVPTPQQAVEEGLGLDSVPDAPSVPGETPQGTIQPSDQIPAPGDVLSQPGLDDVDNDPSQVLTWVCRQQDKLIAVESKDIKNWQAVADAQGAWQCQQNIPQIPDQSLSFSCEPAEKIGLLSVYWLQGAGGKAQMTAWMTALANQRGMVCTADKTNPYWQ